MQQVRINGNGGTDELIVEDIADLPKPDAGEILVAVEAAGINYIDIYQRKGFHKMTGELKLGMEGVGRILQIGESSGNREGPLEIGQRVAWVNTPGSYASHVMLSAARAIAIPEDFTIGQALLFQGLTAQYLVTEYRDIKPGDLVFIHSAAGGLGQLLVQWFRHLGAKVIGATSSEAKAATAKAVGADLVIQYGPDYAFLDELLLLTNGRGVQLAIDGVGEATLSNTLKGLARGGTAITIGATSGVPPTIETHQLRDQCIRLAGGSVFSYIADPPELQQRAAVLITAIQEGWLKMDEGTAYDLHRAEDAHKDLESRRTQGKLYFRL